MPYLDFHSFSGISYIRLPSTSVFSALANAIFPMVKGEEKFREESPHFGTAVSKMGLLGATGHLVESSGFQVDMLCRFTLLLAPF